jgi:hypothetical protein
VHRSSGWGVSFTCRITNGKGRDAQHKPTTPGNTHLRSLFRSLSRAPVSYDGPEGAHPCADVVSEVRERRLCCPVVLLYPLGIHSRLHLRRQKPRPTAILAGPAGAPLSCLPLLAVDLWAVLLLCRAEDQHPRTRLVQEPPGSHGSAGAHHATGLGAAGSAGMEWGELGGFG